MPLSVRSGALVILFAFLRTTAIIFISTCFTVEVSSPKLLSIIVFNQLRQKVKLSTGWHTHLFDVTVDLGLHAALTRQGKSLIAEHLFVLQIARICRTLFVLCVKEKKE